MIQKNTSKRTFRKVNFVWVVLLLVVFFYNFPASETYEPYAERNLNQATRSLLSVAGSAGLEKITLLIQEEADVNAVDRFYRTPLMLAAERNSNPEVLIALIENGADVNVILRISPTSVIRLTLDDWTPLMLAASRNANPEILQTLIDNGADVNAVNALGRTALMEAVLNNSNPEILKSCKS